MLLVKYFVFKCACYTLNYLAESKLISAILAIMVINNEDDYYNAYIYVNGA